MAGVVKAMDAAMKSMNLEKISSLMDKFESQFEDLDVQSSYMENTMSQTVTTSIPQNDVDNLMQQVADEAGFVDSFFAILLVIFFRSFITWTDIFVGWNWTWNYLRIRKASPAQPKFLKNKTN